MLRYCFAALAVTIGLAVPVSAAEPVKEGEKLHRYLTQAGQAIQELEFTRMYLAIVRGSRMGPGEGWFKPSESRYDWKWLATRFDANKDGRISAQEFGSADLFARLDRDRDGAIAASDLDWSDSSPYVRQLQMARQWLSQWQVSEPKITKADWDAMFQKLAQGKDHLDVNDLVHLLPRPPSPMPAAAGKKPPGSGMPSKEVLLKGLFSGEVGSPFAGPKLGELAPGFTLPTHDGKRKISLINYRYQKPVVLIFGSFT